MLATSENSSGCRDAGCPPPLEVLKALGNPSSAWSSGWQSCLWQGGWKQMIFEVSSNTNRSMIRSISPNIVHTVICRGLAMLTGMPCFHLCPENRKMRTNRKGTPPCFPQDTYDWPNHTLQLFSQLHTRHKQQLFFFLMHAEQIIFFVLFKFWVSLSTFFCITGDGQGWRKGSSEQSVRWSGRCLPQNLPHQRVHPNAASGRNLVLLLPFPDEWFNSQDNTGIYTPVDPLPLNVPRALTALWPLVCLSAPGTCSNLSTNRMIKGGSHTNNQRNVIVYILKTAKENCQFCPKAPETVFKSELPENRSNLT